MFDLTNLISDFDSEKRLLHLSARVPIKCTKREHGYALAEAVTKILKKHFGDEPGYLITDFSKIVIEPLYIDEYAAAVKKIIDTFLYHGGYARYGFEISRVTAQLGHDVYMGIPANIFNSRDEAFSYINNLIARNQRTLNLESGDPDLETAPIDVKTAVSLD